MTALIAPSHRLRCLLAGFGAVLLAAACAVGLAAPGGYSHGASVAAALLFAGLCMVHAALRPAMVHRIDISGPGQLRLTVQQGVRREETDALPVALLPGSTLWPRLMLLRFGTSTGKRRCVVVLPDSLPSEDFRALAVALGGGAGEPGKLQAQHKIL